MKTTPGAITLGTALLAVLGWSCAPAPVAQENIVATIGGEGILHADFEDYVRESLGEDGEGLASDVLGALFDQFLTEELLLRLTRDRELVPDETSRRDAVAQLLKQSTSRVITEEEVLAYYQAHADEFSLPERVQLRQILVEDRQAAEEALEELRQGVDFAQVARRLSLDPRASLGGEQGEFGRQDLPPAFADAIFALSPGDTSEILKADYYHIFQVAERLPDETLPITQVGEEIRQKLRASRSDHLLAELVNEAQEKYNVKVEARNLPFNYTGSYLSQ